MKCHNEGGVLSSRGQMRNVDTALLAKRRGKSPQYRRRIGGNLALGSYNGKRAMYGLD
jgi:hypothetical protein